MNESVTQGNVVLARALEYVTAGNSIIPILGDGSKGPALAEWKCFQQKLPTENEVRQMFGRPNVGIGLVCGGVSGGAEVIDFDDPDCFEPWKALLPVSLAERLVFVKTPAGYHAAYRCESPGRNQKLAQSVGNGGRIEVAIETRAEGGYVLAPGSPASCHPDNKEYVAIQGDYRNLPQLTADDRDLLIESARSFNQYIKPESIVQPPARDLRSDRPGDDFNNKADWATDVLLPHRWAHVGSRGGTDLWRRDGKSTGISATVNHGGHNLLYVFSSNAAPFDVDKGYTKFTAYAHLNHGGNFAEAAKDLLLKGYGTPAPTEEWLEPESIDEVELLPVKSLRKEMIPKIFSDLVFDVSHRQQCPPDFLAATVLVMVGSLIGCGCGIKPKLHDDWLVVPNLWGGVIASPGAGKSPAMAEVLRPLSEMETAECAKYEQSMKVYDAEFVMHGQQQSALKEEMKKSCKPKSSSNRYPGKSATTQLVEECVKPDELKQRWIDTEAPVAPVRRRFKSNDPTIEKLGELLRDNTRGLLVYRDELMGLLSPWEREDHAEARQFFIEAWDGTGSFTTDRIGRGTISIPNNCLSVLGSTQPDKIARYLQAATQELGNDGLMQRFQVLVYPDPIKKGAERDLTPDSDARKRVIEVVSKIASMDFVAAGAHRDENCRYPFFRFDADGYHLAMLWFDALNRKIETEDNPLLAEHLAKYKSLMPSIALIFHIIALADGTGSSSVSFYSVEMAVDWCDYLETHARRVYGLRRVAGELAAIRLARRIKKGELGEAFTLRELQRRCWSGLKDMTELKEAVEILIDAHLLRVQAVPHGERGGRPAGARYLINPKTVKIDGFGVH